MANQFEFLLSLLDMGCLNKKKETKEKLPKWCVSGPFDSLKAMHYVMCLRFHSFALEKGCSP